MFCNKVLNQCRGVAVRKYYNSLSIRFCSTQVFRRKDQFNELTEKLKANTNGLSGDFVSNVKKDILSLGDRINSQNFDSIFLETCISNNYLDLGKQFFNFLYDRNENISLALKRKYFRLCFLLDDKCSESDKEFLLLLFDRIMKEYPLLDEISCENLSLGLSLTQRWKECLKLLDMSKEYGKPTSLLYSSIIRAAFINGDQSLGWTLLEEMVQKDLKPRDFVYLTIINNLDHSSILHLFKFFEKYCLYMPSPVATFLNEHNQCVITNIAHEGKCKNCNKKLMPITINEKEFKELRDDFLNPVLIGKDIFIKSKPSELEQFQNFLKNSPKVDIVLDGLNIAFSARKKNLTNFDKSKMLFNVVSFLIKKNLRVMVLGRHHMKKWTPRHMNYIFKNTIIFFAEDLSSDDSFLLYATMYNGLGTKFLSRDLMRGHKFLLKSVEKKNIFSMWQQKHQLMLSFVEDNGFVHLDDISKYLLNAQCNNGTWHIPIVEPVIPGMPPHLQALNMKWICTNLNNSKR